jgi:uncharacterized membrane protein YedE/YeeE
MNSGFRTALLGDWTRLRTLGLTVGIQLFLLPLVFGLGIARVAELPVMPLAGVIGGVVFGLSMHWAGGCAAGIWYKSGAGDLGALVAIIGMALGATSAESGPLVAIRQPLQDAARVSLAWTPPPLLSVVTGALLVVFVLRFRQGRPASPTWLRTGTWIGLAATLAWPLSAAAGRNFGLSIVPGTTGLLAATRGHPFSPWDVLLVTGVLIGGWLGARRTGSVRFKVPTADAFPRRFVGGLGLGIGASIAGGCTVGQGLTALPLFAPSALIVMGSIFVGSAVTTRLARNMTDVTQPLSIGLAHQKVQERNS